eukprot:g6100.t1
MDVPVNALRPTLVRALETIEILKQSRKKDGEKIKLAIKELKESAKRESAQKGEIERLLGVEKTLKELLNELKETETKHQRMVENQESLTTDNKALSMEILQLKKENEALKYENNVLKSNVAENATLAQQTVVSKALESIENRQMKTEERNEALIQTLADLQRKHNSLVQVVKHVHEDNEKNYHNRQNEIIDFLSNAVKLSPAAKLQHNSNDSKTLSSENLSELEVSSISSSQQNVEVKQKGMDGDRTIQSKVPSYLKLTTTQSNDVNTPTKISDQLQLDFTVRPHPEYGLCCKLEEGYNVVEFRRLPNGEHGPMQFVGIRKGDRIVEIDGVKVNPETPVRKVMAHLKGQKIIHLKVERAIAVNTPVTNKLKQVKSRATPVVTPAKSSSKGNGEYNLFVNSMTERWQRSSSAY